jgi:transcriptional regulator with XRE-family HTH domain
MTGEELRRRRERLKMTQAELARRLDVQRVTVTRWENGQTAIPRAIELALREIERQEGI